jgi:glycosyltransferase involved in cell wall biosynthesis
MKIIFDYQIFAYQSYGGISRYFVRLAQGLLGLGDQIDVVAPIHRNRYLRGFSGGLVHGVWLERFPPKTDRLILMANRHLSGFKVSGLDADILHETYYSASPVKTAVKGRVITVYDMIHDKFPAQFSLRDPGIKHKRLAVNRSDHIICISQNTKKDLCELFDVPEHKVSVVYLGFDKFDSKIGQPEPPSEVVRPYLLYVGSRMGYKNFERMLTAVALSPALKSTVDIVAFGGGEFNGTEKALIRKLGFRASGVRQVSGDDSVLARLYAEAHAFVYPSVYEGFGLPPLEAMAHDCPVVTSNSSSMPEVVGDAGAYFDPLDIDSQAQAIASVVFSDEYRAALIAAGRQRLPLFSWERCARETQVAYHKALEAS